MTTRPVAPRSDALRDVERVHMIGIGGAGMSALARLYLDQAIAVSGSDQSASQALDDLARLGANTYAGSRPDQVTGASLVVSSSAVPAGDAELQAATRLGIRSIRHAEALGELFNARRGIAIAGTHGKTTTSSMTAVILRHAGLDPAFQIGGEIMDLGTSAYWGAGEWMVVEADEFDRRFLHYTPEIAVLNNVEPDHFECYGTYENMRAAFGAFLDRVPRSGTIVAFGDDERIGGLLAERPHARVVRFGTSESESGPSAGHDVVASDIRLHASSSHFRVSAGDEAAGVTLVIPGIHNVRNALAAMTAAREAGVPLAVAAEALSGFHGARRRLQVVADHAGIKVVDDYAHHPTAVRLMIDALRPQLPEGGRLWAVFQPHLRVRTEELFDEFATAFAAADEVVISDVYSPVGREPDGDYRGSEALVAATGHRRARHIPSLDDVRALLKRELRSGDIALIMGAGSIERLIPLVAQDVRERPDGG